MNTSKQVDDLRKVAQQAAQSREAVLARVERAARMKGFKTPEEVGAFMAGIYFGRLAAHADLAMALNILVDETQEKFRP